MFKRICFIFLSIFIILIFTINHSNAFTVITSDEAYQMLAAGAAQLIDVRTKEEYAFVGSPSIEPNGMPIGYLISWKLFDGLDDNGNKILKDNADFNKLIEMVFGGDKSQPLIIMCACGIRSTFAAERLEALSFTNVYEIDNALREISSYPGGYGGFEGTTYGDTYNGYLGYPGRLASGDLETVTANIDSENDSVSWKDSGLPITFKIDPAKVPKIPKQVPASQSNQNNYLFYGGYPYTNIFSGITNLYQPLSNTLFPPQFAPSITFFPNISSYNFSYPQVSLLSTSSSIINNLQSFYRTPFSTLSNQDQQNQIC